MKCAYIYLTVSSNLELWNNTVEVISQKRHFNTIYSTIVLIRGLSLRIKQGYVQNNDLFWKPSIIYVAKIYILVTSWIIDWNT